ncbi:MAG: restriction endonuclease subunit S [Thiobacillus sp.]|nr:restriction endonuclease subunit S [Thiobacillus sp.]
MPSEWRETTLGEVVNLKRGFDLPAKQRTKGGVPIVSSSGVSDYHCEAKVKAPGVVTGRYGTIGQVFFCEQDFWPLNTTLFVEDFKGNDPKFIFYFLKTVDFFAYSDKAAVPGVNRNHLHTARVQIPDEKTQTEIAQTLGVLDDKIALLHETNATLEAIAQALFKSWFVDFDPVRAKAEGRDPEGVTPEVADQFPSEFEDSELGGIPKGWRTTSVYDLAEYVNGAAYKAFAPNTESRGLPIIKIAELKAGVTSQTAYSDKEMPEKYRIQAGDILFSWSGNPETSIDTFVWPHSAGWLNQHIFRVIVNDAQERVFVLQVLRHLRPVFSGIARNKQTTGLGHVTIADMKRLLVAMPDRAVLGQFVDLVAPIQRRVFENEQQALNLTELRDTLLPRLMSGKFRIPEIQEAIEEATA